MKMLLLVSAVALLVSLAHIQASEGNWIKLNAIYDQADKCKKSLTEDIFVESVSNLTQGRDRCGDKFFCKVQQILLNKQEDFCGNKMVLVRTVKEFNRNVRAGVQCENKLQGVTSNVEVQLSRLLTHVITCIRHRNLYGTSKK
uniref:Interleukin 4/13 a n=1 Tax=Sparus aurata TaxID=8175 RepID=A0A346ASI2_SPAAU|nr:Interleukin 4/13 a [Sparus aurata]